MLQKDIKEQKRMYISEVKTKAKRVKKVYIYGAGKMSQTVSKLLESYNIAFEGYCVSESGDNLRMLRGKRVVGIDEMTECAEDILFIIAARLSKEQQIVQDLKEKGYYNLVGVPKLLGYFEEEVYASYLAPEMEITVGIGCRVNCKYCPQKALIKNYSGTRLMSFDTFRKCIDKLPQDTTIIFSGFCEPFLNDACVDMILYSFEMNRKVKLFTTLEGLTIEKFNLIAKLNFEEVVLHLPDRYGYAHISVNEKYMELLKRVVDSKKASGEKFISYANSQFAVSEDVMEIVRNKVRITGEMNNRAGNLDAAELPVINVDRSKKRFCARSINLNHNVLLPNGDVVMCCNDFGLTHKFGNLLYDTYEDVVLNSKERKKVMKCLCGEWDEYTLCDECSNIEYYE